MPKAKAQAARPRHPRTAPRTPRPAAAEPRLLTLTVDASHSIAPFRVRHHVKALGLTAGDRVRVEILGRDSGPRYDRALAVARRAVEHFGGQLADD